MTRQLPVWLVKERSDAAISITVHQRAWGLLRSARNDMGKHAGVVVEPDPELRLACGEVRHIQRRIFRSV